MMMIKYLKNDINNLLKEIQENTGKQVEPLKSKHTNILRNTGKHSQTDQ